MGRHTVARYQANFDAEGISQIDYFMVLIGSCDYLMIILSHYSDQFHQIRPKPYPTYSTSEVLF